MSSSLLSAPPISAIKPQPWKLGSISVSFGSHGAASSPAHNAELLIPAGQRLILQREQVEQILLPPLDLLYLPAQAESCQRSSFHGWRVTLDPRRLSLLACELSDHRLQPSHCLRQLRSSRALQPRHRGERELSHALQQLLELAGTPSTTGREQLERAGLERCILRLVILLFCDGSQAALAQPADLAGHGRQEVFDDLLAWIQTHLHRPIRLEDLERQSGYSQRSLRNFFHERFRCGPVQWIRRQRLAAARARLLQPEAGATVSKVAEDFGYSSLAQFSRDFQRLFQIRPSQLLREGQRASNADRGAA